MLHSIELLGSEVAPRIRAEAAAAGEAVAQPASSV
jgi:hypothetical protein